MVIAEILLLIAVVLGSCFYIFLIFWEQYKSKKTLWVLKFATIGTILLSSICLLIFDIINKERWWLRVVVIALWLMLLIVNVIIFYLEKIVQKKSKEKQEKENS